MGSLFFVAVGLRGLAAALLLLADGLLGPDAFAAGFAAGLSFSVGLWASEVTVMEVSSCSNCWRRDSGLSLDGVRVTFMWKVESTLSRMKALRAGSK
ncbi:hypothetical protein CH063_05172 [Colletotrichum higginsianum]|uniref:Uncharacterized protein n=1 Tax=Colletotrichum higginsianum (strain IMI 349063) TaxID=759273 RepID=H1UY21_COLHI|nr:hypothetical protein CH063_05172 [Colletotrichum higginsianum]